MKRSRKLGLLFLPLTAACTHNYKFNPTPGVSGVPATPLSGHTIALDLSGVPEAYRDEVDGHTFVITGVREHCQSLLTRFFANERIVEPAAAEYVLELALALDLTPTFGGARCKADATWTVVERAGREIQTDAHAEAAYPVMSNGGRNCEIATLKSLGAGLDAALGKL